MSEVSERKHEHLSFASLPDSESSIPAGWEDLTFVPSSIPATSPDEVDLTTVLVGQELDAPFVIASMTGGHEDALPINAALAEAARELRLAIGTGSQRAALRDPGLAESFTVIRKEAPDALVFANIGICQLVPQGGEPPLSQGEIEAAIDMVGAQALIVHFNVVEEIIQMEGDRNFEGLIDAFANVVAQLGIPVVAKETGSGMSRKTGQLLVEAGASVIDVGGAGGTSFAKIEGMRAAARGDMYRSRLGQTFGDWGVPTSASIIETRSLGVPVIATGGIRNGLDAAKALALGATAIGLGRPALIAAMENPPRVSEELRLFIEELRIAVVLSGQQSAANLRSSEFIVQGATAEWMRRDHAK